MFHFWMVFVPPSTGDVPNVPNVSNITCSKLCTGRILPILRHEEVKGGRQRGETRGEREGRKKECKGLKRAQKFTGGAAGAYTNACAMPRRILPILRHEEVKAGRQRGETRGEREGRKKECKGLKRTQKFTGRRTGHIQMHVRCDAKDSGASRRVACSGSQHPWR